jgi:hypothetical protein
MDKALLGDIMTRCILLDSWFDVQSKKIDDEEKKQNKDLITGE